MKKTKYTEEQIIGAVKQLEAGRAAKDLARELRVTWLKINIPITAISKDQRAL